MQRDKQYKNPETLKKKILATVWKLLLNLLIIVDMEGNVNIDMI